MTINNFFTTNYWRNCSDKVTFVVYFCISLPQHPRSCYDMNAAYASKQMCIHAFHCAISNSVSSTCMFLLFLHLLEFEKNDIAVNNYISSVQVVQLIYRRIYSSASLPKFWNHINSAGDRFIPTIYNQFTDHLSITSVFTDERYLK